MEALYSLSRLQIIHTHTHPKSAWKLTTANIVLHVPWFLFLSFVISLFSLFFFLHLHKMTKSLPHSPKQNKPPDPIVTSTSNLSKSSLASSAASLSPSTSILLSAAANRTFVPSSRSSSYRKAQSPIMPLPSSSSISTSSTSSSTRNAKLESIIQVRSGLHELPPLAFSQEAEFLYQNGSNHYTIKDTKHEEYIREKEAKQMGTNNNKLHKQGVYTKL